MGLMSTVEDKFYHPRITKRIDFAPDLWMIRINPGGEFRFAPGQYATLGVDGSQKRVERPYSIVSSPYENEIEFFFELVPQGDLTPVTGIAPFVSYVRTLYKDWKEGKFAGEHKLFLLNGASRSWEFGYHDELQEFAGQVPWLKYVPTVSRPWDDQNWKGETGRADDVLRKYADMWGLTGENCVGYLCGHPEMIEHGKGILKRHGFPKEALKEEVYWIPDKKAAV